MSPVVYLISGANRGIGLGMVQKFAAKHSDAIIYAGARDPSKATALQELAKGNPNVKPVKLISTDLETNKSVADQIKQEQGGVDVVIANAGIAKFETFTKTADISLETMREHFEVNTLGPLVLFQQVNPILRGERKFVTISTILASLATDFGMPMTDVPYGVSKTAVNSVLKHIHDENPDVVVAAIHPGWVQTDMGNAGAKGIGMEAAPTTLEDSTTGLVKVIDELKRGDKLLPFIDFEGVTRPF